MPDSVAQHSKILLVLPNFAGGGAERVALTLLAGLDRGTFRPELVVFDDQGPLRSLPAPDITRHHLARPRLRHALPALVRLIRRERPTIVFATQGYVNMALLAVRPLLPAATKIVLRESNTPSQNLPNERYPRLMAWAYRHLYPKADLVFCQHRQTQDELEDIFGVPGARLASLANPVPEDRLRHAAKTPERAPGPGLRFVAAGRLHRQKGFDRLIVRFGELPDDSRLTIFGEGPEEGALRRLIRERGLEARITLAGFTARLPAALAGADACVVPSRWEGLPNIALEALAVGTPVIVTPESGGIAELAEAAPPGAVTLAELPDGGPAAFLAAMGRVTPRNPAVPAASLLPARYRVETVAASFNAQLRALAGIGGGQ